MNERSGPATFRGLASHLWTNRAIVLTWVVIAGAAVSLRFVIADLDPGRVFPDTPGYVRVAENSILSEGFLAGERPFTLPILYKLLGISSDNYQSPPAVLAITAVQTTLAAVSWLVLGLAVAFQLKSALTSTLAFITVQLFGLSLHISQWDALLLSESVSTSLTACLMGLVLFSMHPRVRRERFGRWFRVALGLLVVVTMILYAFARDLNAYVLLLVALLAILPILFIRLVTQGRGDRELLGALITLLVVFVLSQASAAKGERWRMPFYGTVQQRVLTNEANTARLVELGMPEIEFPEFLDVHLPRRSFFTRLTESRRMQPFVDWMDHRGRQAYLIYLLTNPRQSIGVLLADHQSLLSPLSTEYRSAAAETPAWLESLTELMYPLGPAASLMLPLAYLIAGFSMLTGPERNALWKLAVLLLITLPPLMFIIWHSDSIEIERHAYPVGLHLRFGLWLLLVNLFGWIVHTARQRSGIGA